MPNFKEASSNVNRARQFMPFAALKGYYDLVDQKERLVEPRRDMSEEDALQLSCELAQIRKGSLVRVVHYDQNAYVSTEGMVSQIDETFHTLTVVKKTIQFEDILSLESADIKRDSIF